MQSVREYAPYIDRDQYANSRLVRECDLIQIFNIAYSGSPEFDHVIPVKIEYINSDEVGDMSSSGIPFIVWENKRLHQGQTYNLSIRQAANIIYDYACGADLRLSKESCLSVSQNISAARIGITSPTNRLATLSNQYVDRYALDDDEEQQYAALQAKSKNMGACKINVIAMPCVPIEAFAFLNDTYFIQQGG
ncbi:MAG: hypothetical protein ACRCX2_12055 [Paraclostridium sp.]